MDPLPAFDQAPTFTPTQRDRRREKQQLSCNFCRSRKIRCDRQHPCKTCVGKDIALSCTYSPGPQRKATVGVGDRIQQLEAMVRSLMQEQQQQSLPSENLFAISPAQSFPGGTPQSLSTSRRGATLLASVDDGVLPPPLHNRKGDATPTSPVLSEHGNMRLHSHGANYVSNVHWAAILDSISELNDVYETEREVAMLASSDYVPHYSPGPRLLYEPVQATKDEILSSIPTRPVVDRMISRYFNIQGVAPAVLSSSQFLRDYDNFWQDPGAAPFAWIGLLFSIMCLSTQYQQLTEDPADPETVLRVHMFRERTVHCLVLGQFTKGGPHVLETMIIHCTSEVFMCKDAEIGLWLLLGMVVQLALSLGYHRDPQNFPHISPFAGEMRRRVWAAIVQMDLRLSSQMGLPRLLQSKQCDTSEPRNLLDSDFDEAIVELPPSRSETEVTPVLYGLAKIRIDSIGALISDLVADTREHPLSEIMNLDEKLHAAQASLPLIFQWLPLSQSLMVPPQIVLHRLGLQLAVHKLVISLHRRYLSASYAPDEYEYSRNACVRAAIKILEFQQIVHEETQPDGLLYPVRWLLSSLMQSIFLLGMSVLCYYVQLVKSTTNVPLDRDKIIDLLRNTYPIWLRLSTVSQDARKAVEHLSLVLGLRNEQDGIQPAKKTTTALSDAPDEQVSWDACHGIADFPQLLDTDLMTWDAPRSSSSGNMFSTDWLLDYANQLDESITVRLSSKGRN